MLRPRENDNDVVFSTDFFFVLSSFYIVGIIARILLDCRRRFQRLFFFLFFFFCFLHSPRNVDSFHENQSRRAFSRFNISLLHRLYRRHHNLTLTEFASLFPPPAPASSIFLVKHIFISELHEKRLNHHHRHIAELVGAMLNMSRRINEINTHTNGTIHHG